MTTTGNSGETVTLGGTTYAVERDDAGDVWLTGQRGATGCLLRDPITGRVLPVGLRAALKLDADEVTAVLAPLLAA